jgi:hypothetical protein
VALVRLNEGRWAEAAESARLAIACAREHKDELCVMHCLFQLQVATIMALEVQVKKLATAIVATAILESAALVTKDPRILDYPAVDSIW